MVSDPISFLANLFYYCYHDNLVRKTKWKTFIQARKFSIVFQLIDYLAASNDGDEFEKSAVTYKLQI